MSAIWPVGGARDRHSKFAMVNIETVLCVPNFITFPQAVL